MVDENGCCEDRGMSGKQFFYCVDHLEESYVENTGCWVGSRGGAVNFWTKEYEGQIGRYHVILFENKGFHFSYGVKVIEPIMTEEEWKELEDEKKRVAEELKNLRSKSNWIGEIKERLELEVKVLKVSEFEGRYGRGTRFEFLDNDGNILVWFTNSAKDMKENGQYKIRGTVKDHSEWQGCKQTIINRVFIVKGA